MNCAAENLPCVKHEMVDVGNASFIVSTVYYSVIHPL